jgi:hypothetical protein
MMRHTASMTLQKSQCTRQMDAETWSAASSCVSRGPDISESHRRSPKRVQEVITKRTLVSCSLPLLTSLARYLLQCRVESKFCHTLLQRRWYRTTRRIPLVTFVDHALKWLLFLMTAWTAISFAGCTFSALVCQVTRVK